MAYFTEDFRAFFRELEQNNHKEWFDANRQRYERDVKQPFNAFVQEMIGRIRVDDPLVDIAPRDAIFRIHRDIRFTADKTPYKTEVSAIISRTGKKDKGGFPGLFFQLRHAEVRIYSGIHMMNKDRLHRIRRRIAANLEEFARLLADRNFREKFGEVRGDRHKRLPAEFQEAAQVQPLLYNKSFYYFAVLPGESITDAHLPDILMEHYFAAKPLNQFFIAAMQ